MKRIAALQSTYQEINNLKFYFDDSPNLTVSELRSKLRRYKNNYNIKLVLIDYLQLIKPESNRDNRVNELSEITRNLKQLAKEFDLPVISLSQLSRQVENRDDKRPLLSDLRSQEVLNKMQMLSCLYIGKITTCKEMSQLGVLTKLKSRIKKHDSWKDRNEEVFNKAELLQNKEMALLVRLNYTLMINIPNSWELKKCIKLVSQMKFIENIGKIFISIFSNIGKFILFILFFFKYLFGPKFYFKNNIKYFISVFVSSIPIVALTGIFSGMVLALQSYTGFSRFSAESAIPNIVVLTLTRELGPVLTGLMISARVGSSIAAEIATMRVTEQIDALKTLNTNYYNYLVTPRVLSLTLALPIFVTLVNFIGVMGGYTVSVHRLGFNDNLYLLNTIDF